MKTKKEYKKWCDKKEFNIESRYVVTGSKLNLFLHEEVLDRYCRKGPKGKN